MKVLVADNVSPVTLDKIREAGLELIYEPTYTGDSLQQGLSEHDPTILVVRSTKVLGPMMDAAKNLELIVRAGAGTDNIDSAHASRRGIYVTNCPGKNSHAVAELVMGLMLATDRRIPEGVEMLNRGRWNKAMFAGSRGLKGRTLGIIGLGNIGRLVAARAQAFEMKVVGYDPFVPKDLAEAWEDRILPSPEAVAQVSDFITFHVPSLPQTRGMINEAFLQQCRPDVVLINTSRGDIVNEEELLAGLDARPNLWYACDVHSGEPTTNDVDFVCRLAQHPRVYGTQHIGASTKQSEAAIGEEALRVILQYGQKKLVDRVNCVNLNPGAIGCCTINMRHSGEGNSFAYALRLLLEAGYKVDQANNQPFQGGQSYISSVTYDCGPCGSNCQCEKCAEIINDLNSREDVFQASFTCSKV